MSENKCQAFTLLETLIVVCICVSFALVPVLSLRGIQEEMEVNQFFRSFEKRVLLTYEMCLVQAIKGTVTVRVEQLSFSSLNTKEQTLPLPKSLEITEFPTDNTLLFSEKGNNSFARHLTFRNKNTGKVIKYQFLVGSGKYRVYKE